MNTKKEENEDTKKKKKKSTLKIHLKPPTGVLLGGVTDTLRSSVLMRSMTGQTTWVGSRAMRSSRGSIQPAGATLQNTGMGDRESGIGNRKSGAVGAGGTGVDRPDVRWEMCQFCPACVRSSPMAGSVLLSRCGSVCLVPVWRYPRKPGEVNVSWCVGHESCMR